MPAFTIEVTSPAGPGDTVFVVVEEETVYDTKDCPLCKGTGFLRVPVVELGREGPGTLEVKCPGNPWGSGKGPHWDCEGGKVYSTEREHVVVEGEVRIVKVAATSKVTRGGVSGFRPMVRLLVAWKGGKLRSEHKTHEFSTNDIYLDKATAEREANRLNSGCHCH